MSFVIHGVPAATHGIIISAILATLLTTKWSKGQLVIPTVRQETMLHQVIIMANILSTPIPEPVVHAIQTVGSVSLVPPIATCAEITPSLLMIQPPASPDSP